MGQTPSRIDPVEDQRATAVAKLERELVQAYGLLLTIEHLAQLFHRPIGGLRWTLNQPEPCEFAKAINASRTKAGRRSYYRATDLAALLAGDGAVDE